MSLTAILLITLSAFAHAFWNYLSKRNDPSTGFFWIATLASAVVLLPLLVVFSQGLPFIRALDWALIAATGMCQALYYVGLAGAYRNGDLSMAYPLARSLPVLLVASVSLLLGRGGQIGALALAGFFLVALGCLALPLPRFRDFHPRHYLNRCCLFAVLAAIGTTGYTLIDDQVLRNLRTAAAMPLPNTSITLMFMSLENLSLMIALGLYVMLYRPDRSTLQRNWKSSLLAGSVTGLVMSGAYGLVLLAMAYVSNVSYVSAFRQLSLPIGAFLGMVVGQEPRRLPRLVGLAVILAGLVMVALG